VSKWPEPGEEVAFLETFVCVSGLIALGSSPVSPSVARLGQLFSGKLGTG